MEIRLQLKRAHVTVGAIRYETWRLFGKDHRGQRVRFQHQEKAVVLGEKQRLEIEAANADGGHAARLTELSSEQLREAEDSMRRLNGRSLTFAVEYFLKHFREPKTEKPIAEAAPDFLAAKRPELRPATLASLKGSMKLLVLACGKMRPHEPDTSHILALLESRRVKTVVDEMPALVPIGPKRWNNLRADLHLFFEWCRAAPRKWRTDNPVTEVPSRRVTQSLPTILHVGDAAEFMRFVVGYKGGVMVPYFALTLFAGIRPSTREGEIVKLAAHPRLTDLISLERGIMTIPPEVAKDRRPRQVKIQPNLAEWLRAYPLEKFPLCPAVNLEGMVDAVRRATAITGDDDILRHTFITMHVCAFRSIGDAALEAGNSETMIKKHYLNMVTQAEALLFWETTPHTLGKKPQSTGSHPG